MQAPGGFLAAYAAGRSIGSLLAGCPVVGACDTAIPLLVALTVGLIGMGVGCGLASLELARWWEAVGVWAAGVVALIATLVIIGLVGASDPAGLGLAVLFVVGAVISGVRRWRRRPSGRTPGSPAP